MEPLLTELLWIDDVAIKRVRVWERKLELHLGACCNAGLVVLSFANTDFSGLFIL